METITNTLLVLTAWSADTFVQVIDYIADNASGLIRAALVTIGTLSVAAAVIRWRGRARRQIEADSCDDSGDTL